MSEKVKTQAQWIANHKTHGCNSCHQVGNKATRHISKDLGTFDSSYSAWMHRLQTGPSAENMIRAVGELDTQLAIRNLAGTVKLANGGKTTLVFASDFTMPTLTRP